MYDFVTVVTANKHTSTVHAGMWTCKMPGLPARLEHKLNIVTVADCIGCT